MAFVRYPAALEAEAYRDYMTQSSHTMSQWKMQNISCLF